MSSFGEDEWDSIVNLDSQVHENGYNDGLRDAETSGMLQNGMRGGFLKGLAFGLECGFVEKSCQLLIEPKIADIEASNRTEKRVSEVVAKCEAILHAHEQEIGEESAIDYDEAIRQLRSLHKQLGAPLGSFPPKFDSSTTKKMVSSEW